MENLYTYVTGAIYSKIIDGGSSVLKESQTFREPFMEAVGGLQEAAAVTTTTTKAASVAATVATTITTTAATTTTTIAKQQQQQQ